MLSRFGCEIEKFIVLEKHWKLGYTYVNRKMGNPKTDRKMNDFRIFCELLAKTMLKAIDFTDVVEVYRRNEKPEILGIATCQLLTNQIKRRWCRNEKPEILGIAT